MRRYTMIALFSVVIVVLCIVLVTGINASRLPWQWPRSAGRETMTQSFEFAAEDVQNMNMRLTFHDVRIIPGEADTVRIEEWSDQPLSDPIRLRCQLAGGTLEADTLSGGTGCSFFGQHPRVQIVVAVPPKSGLAVQAWTGAGDLDVQDVRLGDISLSTGAGDIVLSDTEAGGSVLHTSAGDIDVLAGTRLQSMDSSSAAGSVDVEAEVNNQAVLSSASGDVRFIGSCRSFEGSTGAGNVDGSFERVKSVKATSSAGDVDLLMQKNTGVREIFADSGVGDISVGLPAGSRIQLKESRGLGDLELENKAGFEITSEDAILLDLHASAGDIELFSS